MIRGATQVEARQLRRGQLILIEARPKWCAWCLVERCDQSTSQVTIHYSWSYPPGFEASRVRDYCLYDANELVTVAPQ